MDPTIIIWGLIAVVMFAVLKAFAKPVGSFFKLPLPVLIVFGIVACTIGAFVAGVR